MGAILVALGILCLGFWMGEAPEEPAARPPNAPSPKPSPGPGEEARQLPPEPLAEPDAEGTLEVEVVSGNTPLPGVQVRLYVREPADLQSFPASWSGRSQGETGATGRWAVAAAPGSYYVTARVQGSAPGYAAVVHPPGSVRTQVQVRMEEGAEAFGLVLEKATHEPISLAEVVFTPPSFNSSTQDPMDAPEDERLVTTTLETGEFRLPYLAPGRYRIEARAPGYVSAVLPSAPIPFGGRITLMLKPGGQLEGVVLRADGQPAAGAEVLAIGPEQDATVRTDNAGNFSFDLPPSTYTVSARSSEETGVLRGVAVAVGQRVQGLSMRLGASARIAGTVVRKDGSPVLGARVGAWLAETWDAGRHYHRQTFAGTDERGAFSLPPLAEDTYVINVFLPGGGRLQERRVTLAAGEHASLTFLCEPRDGVECQLQEPEEGSPQSTRAFVQGRILPSRGIPVRHVIVGILSVDPALNATRYKKGRELWNALQAAPKPISYEFLGDRFELRGLSPGPSVLMITADGMKASLHLDLRPGESRALEIPVYPAVSMTGRILDAATHQPVALALVHHPLSGLSQTGGDGRFAFRELPPGEHILYVSRHDSRTKTSTLTMHIVRLTTNPENDLGDIEVPAP